MNNFKLLNYIDNFFQILNKKLNIKKPSYTYKFTTLNLQSNMELINIINDIVSILPQYSKFIDQFNSVISVNNINVVTDTYGNLSIDIPNSMSDADGELLRKKVGIIDNLINTHGDNLHNLFEKAKTLQQQTPDANTTYKSQIAEKLAEYNKLKNSYKH